MGDIINNVDGVVKNIDNEESGDLVTASEKLLQEVRLDLNSVKSMSMPISQLATLGMGVSSLLPALRTVTQTTTVDTQGLYKLANKEVGDVLKAAKNGNYYGAYKTADGKSKLVQLQTANPASVTNNTVMPINPATMMMSVTLFSIEQQLENITEMGKQILSFLEIEKEAEVEADIEMLSNIITKYKHNWDNEHFVSSNHNQVLNIQRTARKNMISYQKKVSEALGNKKFVVAKNTINSMLKDLQKKFKYYRLSLYTFAMASFIEIMLSGNFREESINTIKEGIEKYSFEYRDLFSKCSSYLEKMTSSSIETNVLKGIGVASGAVGKFIGRIPVVKEGPVDEFLQDSGYSMKKNAQSIEKSVLETFAEISNPGTRVFLDRMDEMICIYNYTTDICFDDKKIYLIAR